MWMNIKSVIFKYSCLLLGLNGELDELLMEAQLLQVSLPEVQELYQVLMTQPSTTNPESNLTLSAKDRGPNKQQGTEWNAARSEVTKK